MLWFVKIKEAIGDNLLISYSCEESRECDGVLEYNPNTDEVKVIKQAVSSNDSLTNKLMVLIPHAYKKGLITKNINNISIG